jgi:hypothetical protein
MKLYIVKTEWTIPIGAEDKDGAVSLVADFLDKHEQYQELGFDDVKIKASLTKSIKDVPKNWRDTDVFNDEDLSNIYIKDFFNGKLQETIKESRQSDKESRQSEIIDKLREVSCLASQLEISHSDLIDMLKKLER